MIHFVLESQGKWILQSSRNHVLSCCCISIVYYHLCYLFRKMNNFIFLPHTIVEQTSTLTFCLIVPCSSLHISVFMEWLRRTWWTAAHQPPTLLVVSICVPPVSGSWSFRVIAGTVLVVGVLLLRAHRPGIHYQTVFVTQHWVSTCLGVSWRHTFLRNIDKMYSAH